MLQNGSANSETPHAAQSAGVNDTSKFVEASPMEKTDDNVDSNLDPPVAESRTRKPAKKKRPNYGHIHRRPLPLETYPLPAFHPTNPVSILRLIYTYFSHLLVPPSSHPHKRYIGIFSSESRSIHVTEPTHIRALWEMGFFGKGSLSRSEPSWLDREKARIHAKYTGGTAEEATQARREKRRLFKLERARIEVEKIERQRLIEEGKLDPSMLESIEPAKDPSGGEQVANHVITEPRAEVSRVVADGDLDEFNLEERELELENQEFLQLTMEEAFFLSYGLGVLDIQTQDTRATPELFQLFAQHSFFPPKPSFHNISPDDPFIISYVVYHHFRSLGWVVRPGIKFSVDYLLYYRGPVFSHAEFAVMIMPSYTDPYWTSAEGSSKRRIKENEQKDWWWLHCINRVQSQVLKTLVLAYVDIPSPLHLDDQSIDVGRLLRGYKVREFVLKRWVANRERG